MFLNEFIKETNKNQMISTLLKYYKVESVKMRYKYIKDHAHYNVDKGTLELSTKYKDLKPNQIKQFLITIVHEIHHAMMAKKYGWKKFKSMWEYEANMITQGHRPEKTDPYGDNPYELEAEEFGQKNWKKWKDKFKKDGLI
tara:strand:- start:469 stop:891 length:423 start_codon:yes stop_codon:yes gene_type:complete